MDARQLAVAVDIGGTKVEAGLVTPEGEVVAGTVHRAPTGTTSTVDSLTLAVIGVASAALASAAPDAEVVGIGIGSAGPVDLAAGAIAPLNMPDAAGTPVVEVLRALAPRLPVRLALDGTCIALAEHGFGAARGARNALAMVVSTGVGGGLVLDGRPLTGSSGNAGHIGQLRLRGRADDDPATAGTLEAIASGPSAVAWARRRGWEGTTGEDLAADCAAGVEVARAAVVRSARAVGEAIASVSTLLDLDVAVVAGGFSNVTADYIDLVREAAAASAVFDYARRVRIVPTGLGGRGPLVGAASLVLR